MSIRCKRGSRLRHRSLAGSAAGLVLAATAVLAAVETPRTRTLGIPFQRLTTADGLSQETVNCVLQDRTGFLWVGTQGGLNRFDGYEFRVYRNDPAAAESLPADWIMALAEDPSGDLWIGAKGGGLSRWRRESDTIERVRMGSGEEDDPAAKSVRALLVDREGALWVGTERAGLTRLAAGERHTFRHDPRDPASLSDDRVRALAQDRAGNLWVGTLGGLHRFDRARGTFTRFRHDPADLASLSNDRVFSILADSVGGLWVGTENGVNYTAAPTSTSGMTTFERFGGKPEDGTGLAGGFVISLLEDRDGRLWVATLEGGLHLLRPDGTFANYRHDPADLNSLSSDRVRALYQDRGGVLWVGAQNALNRWHPDAWSFGHYRGEGGTADSVTSFSEDEDGRLYLGTLAGLEVFDRESGRSTRYRHDPADPASLPGDQVAALLRDRSGVLWIGTFGGGVGRLEPPARPGGRARFRNYRHDPARPRSLGSDFVSALGAAADGGLWVGTFRAGLDRFRDGVFEHFAPDPNDPGSLSDEYVTALAVSDSGTVWVGTHEGGLNRLREGAGDRARFERFLHDPEDPESLSSDMVNALHVDANGNLWVGTQVGLNRLLGGDTGRRFRRYLRSDGLPDNAVMGILSDDSGRLWVSTHNGLARFEPRTEDFKTFDRSHGLQGDDFFVGSRFRSRGGELLFGGGNGFNVLHPDRVAAAAVTAPPPVVLTAFLKRNRPQTFDRPLFDLGEVKLGWRDDFFDVEFAVLDYTAPERNRYRYMLEGFHRDWVEIGTRRRVSFTNLDPGGYVLRVQGANHDGVWNLEGARLSIRVEPAPWRTSWAWALYAALVVLALGVFLRGQRAKIEKERTQTRERDRLIGELERKNAELLRFNYTVSHDLKAPLVTIKGFVSLLARDRTGVEASDRFRHDLDRISSAADHMWSLLDDLEGYSSIGRPAVPARGMAAGEVASEALELLEGLMTRSGVEVTIAPDLPALDGSRLRLRLLFQNLLENAAKYMGDQPSPRVEVGARRDGGKTVIFVRDNGIGIDPRYRETIFGLFERLDAADEGTGVGLAMARRIVESHGGRIWAESEGEGQGSTFCFTWGEGLASAGG